MTLSETDIEERLNAGSLTIDRNGEVCVEPSSVDLHLAETILEPVADGPVDVTDASTYPELREADTTIPPWSFRLGSTEEHIELPEDMVGLLWGRSSVGRLGLFVHNAGLVDAGFRGDLTLELVNAAPYPITLKPSMRIAQITLHDHESPPRIAYGAARASKYNGQEGPTASRLSEDFDGDL